jgi:hypothetical protein
VGDVESHLVPVGETLSVPEGQPVGEDVLLPHRDAAGVSDGKSEPLCVGVAHAEKEAESVPLVDAVLLWELELHAEPEAEGDTRDAVEHPVTDTEAVVVAQAVALPLDEGVPVRVPDVVALAVLVMDTVADADADDVEVLEAVLVDVLVPVEVAEVVAVPVRDAVEVELAVVVLDEVEEAVADNETKPDPIFI